MIDAALVLWTWQIATAIPLETLAYAAILVVTVWVQQHQGVKWQERVHALERTQGVLLTHINNMAATMDLRLAWQDKMVGKMWDLLGVRVADSPDTSESPSDEADE